MACSRPTARTSASIGLDLQTAHTASAVTTITDVASVPVVAMEQAVAVQLSDPRCIVTLLDPSRTEVLLRDYGILDDWGHVVAGLREGFDVGVSPRQPDARTYIFRESPFIYFRPQIHRRVHSQRAGCRAVLCRILSRRTRRPDRTVSNVPSRVDPKTPLRLVANDPGPLIPERELRNSLGKCWGELGRLSYGLGKVQRRSCYDISTATRLCSGHLRHRCSLPADTYSPRPAVCSLCVLGRKGLCRQGLDVWAYIECWGVRIHCRHACSDLQGSWDPPPLKMGRRFFRDTVTYSDMERGGFYGFNWHDWSSLESCKNESTSIDSAVHWVRLGFQSEDCRFATMEACCCDSPPQYLGGRRARLLTARGCQLTWKASAYFLYLPSHPTVSTIDLSLRKYLCFSAGKAACSSWTQSRSYLDIVPAQQPSEYLSSRFTSGSRSGLVGGRKHLLWNWSCHREVLGRMEMGTRIHCGTTPGVRHRVGRGGSCGAWTTLGLDCRFIGHTSGCFQHLLGSIGQLWGSCSTEQGSVEEQGNQYCAEARLPAPSAAPHTRQGYTCAKPRQYRRCAVQRRYRTLLGRIPFSKPAGLHSATWPPRWQTDTVVMPVARTIGPMPRSPADLPAPGSLRLNLSPLRPNCKAGDRIFLWRGINTPPLSTIDDPTIRFIENMASHASLRDTTNYGSGLHKFHIFCDIFTVPETWRLPASFELLHSFALWAATDPELVGLIAPGNVAFEPIAVSGVRKYLAAIRAWHISQGWPVPLTEDHFTHINWSLRGLENLQGGTRRRPPRPPVTIPISKMLNVLIILRLS